MNATPAFKDRESEFATDVPQGARVRGDWGAMHPSSYGVVDACERHPTYVAYFIKWDDSNGSWHQIRRTRSANGSPIGVWLV